MYQVEPRFRCEKRKLGNEGGGSEAPRDMTDDFSQEEEALGAEEEGKREQRSIRAKEKCLLAKCTNAKVQQSKCGAAPVTASTKTMQTVTFDLQENLEASLKIELSFTSFGDENPF